MTMHQMAAGGILLKRLRVMVKSGTEGDAADHQSL